MEKVRPQCGQPSDRGRLKIRSDRQALSTARFRRAGQLATADTCYHNGHPI